MGRDAIRRRHDGTASLRTVVRSATILRDGAQARDRPLRRPRRLDGARRERRPRGRPPPPDAVLRPGHALHRSTHGGTVEKFAGDAVMAAFGVPLAHEDDPERAVRARSRSSRASASSASRCGSGSSRARSSPTRPSRPSPPAWRSTSRPACSRPPQPGEILLGPTASGSSRGRRRLEPLEPQELRGFPDRVEAWRVVSAADESAAGSSSRRRSSGARRSSSCSTTPLRASSGTTARTSSPSSASRASASRGSRASSSTASSARPSSPAAACPTARASRTGRSPRW